MCGRLLWDVWKGFQNPQTTLTSRMAVEIIFAENLENQHFTRHIAESRNILQPELFVTGHCYNLGECLPSWGVICNPKATPECLEISYEPLLYLFWTHLILLRVILRHIYRGWEDPCKTWSLFLVFTWGPLSPTVKQAKNILLSPCIDIGSWFIINIITGEIDVNYFKIFTLNVLSFFRVTNNISHPYTVVDRIVVTLIFI
jgi:hypothetical protein